MAVWLTTGQHNYHKAVLVSELVMLNYELLPTLKIEVE